MKKISQLTLATLLISLILPNLVFASWWNPFSWFSKKNRSASIATSIEANKPVAKLEKSTKPVATSSPIIKSKDIPQKEVKVIKQKIEVVINKAPEKKIEVPVANVTVDNSNYIEQKKAEEKAGQEARALAEQEKIRIAKQTEDQEKANLLAKQSIEQQVISDTINVKLALDQSLGGDIQPGLNKRIWLSKVSSDSNKDIYLNKLSLKIIGSIPYSTLENIKLYISGNQVSSADGIDSNGYLNFNLISPQSIGLKDIEVRADISTIGSSRTFTVSIQNLSGIEITGPENASIYKSFGGSQSTGVFTVTSGSVVVSVDQSLPSGDIKSGSINVPLARYVIKAFNGDVKVNNFFISSSVDLENAELYINNEKQDRTRNILKSNSSGFAVFLKLNDGNSAILEIRGDVKNNVEDSKINITLLSGELFSASGYAPAITKELIGPTMTVVAE